MLAERGIDASYETVRRWFLKFGPSIAANICRSRPRPSNHWHLDEMVISIRGGKYWLWRAVDNEGEVLDFLVQRRRDAQAAKKLMVKLPAEEPRLCAEPGCHRSAAILSGSVSARSGSRAEHDRGLRANDRAENSPQARSGILLVALADEVLKKELRSRAALYPSSHSFTPYTIHPSSRALSLASLPGAGMKLGLRHRGILILSA